MGFGYDEYVTRVRELANLGDGGGWKYYGSWTPYQLQSAAKGVAVRIVDAVEERDAQG